MSKHKSEDYKITAVKYYLENDTNYTKTCEIFKCSERSLKRWIERYKELEEIKNAIEQVKKENYKNYFENAYNKDAHKDYVKKDSTLKRKPKNYKD